MSEPGNSPSLACLLSPPAPLDSVGSLTFMYLGTCCSPPGMPFHSSCSPGMRAHLSVPSSNGSLAGLPGSLSLSLSLSLLPQHCLKAWVTAHTLCSNYFLNVWQAPPPVNQAPVLIILISRNGVGCLVGLPSSV